MIINFINKESGFYAYNNEEWIYTPHDIMPIMTSRRIYFLVDAAYCSSDVYRTRIESSNKLYPDFTFPVFRQGACASEHDY